MVVAVLMLLMMFAVHCTWVTSNAYSSPSIGITNCQIYIGVAYPINSENAGPTAVNSAELDLYHRRNITVIRVQGFEMYDNLDLIVKIIIN